MRAQGRLASGLPAVAEVPSEERLQFSPRATPWEGVSPRAQARNEREAYTLRGGSSCPASPDQVLTCAQTQVRSEDKDQISWRIPRANQTELSQHQKVTKPEDVTGSCHSVMAAFKTFVHESDKI